MKALLPKSLYLLRIRNLLKGLSAMSVKAMDTLLVVVVIENQRKRACYLKRSESEKPDISKGKFIAFMEISGSVTPQVSSNDGTNHDNGESKTEHDWQA